jgi:hypothetical protein
LRRNVNTSRRFFANRKYLFLLTSTTKNAEQPPHKQHRLFRVKRLFGRGAGKRFFLEKGFPADLQKTLTDRLV